eukprot:TRINITY_DN62_c5_g1_i1.p3 TRINITY_DN62_c5_g1~~TRINITY_DN62_c5_g1_i1.p3  ORF type:complete len:132 (+),score=2.06 TRINITY_DN62_c5_g1_i1:513-908(+)
MVIDQRIKGTPGITGQLSLRGHIDGIVWHLDVDLSYPGVVGDTKGSAVRRLKWYMSWVQNVVRQFGPYLPQMLENCLTRTFVREEQEGKTYCEFVVQTKSIAKKLRLNFRTAENILSRKIIFKKFSQSSQR